MKRAIFGAVALSGLLFGPSATIAADGTAATAIAEPAVLAVPVDVDIWKRKIGRELYRTERFRGLPEMKLGLIVSETGTVTECLALPLTDGEPARGQIACPLVIEYARFEPARDADGSPVRSVFIAQFGNSRPVNATTGQVP